MKKPRHEMTFQELHDDEEILDIYSFLCEDLWESFWKKVDVRGRDECWPYQKQSRNQLDYGIFSYYTPKGTYPWGTGNRVDGTIAAHKLAYIFGEEHTFEEPIKRNEVIMHKCRTRSSDRDHDLRCCCNPRHLKRGTQLENIRDAISAGTFRPFGKTMLIARGGDYERYDSED